MEMGVSDPVNPVVFAKGWQFLLALGEGFGVRFRGVVGGGLPFKIEGTGRGGGEGGTGKGTGKSMRKLFRSYPLAN